MRHRVLKLCYCFLEDGERRQRWLGWKIPVSNLGELPGSEAAEIRFREQLFGDLGYVSDF